MLEIIKLSYEVINYELCNETSMVNALYLYMIDMKLDELYCIDMEDLYRRKLDTDFLNFVQFDLYICKNGIDYDKNNKYCTSYEQIAEMTGKYRIEYNHILRELSNTFLKIEG